MLDAISIQEFLKLFIQELRTVVGHELFREETSTQGKVRRSRRTLVAAGERAIPKDEDARWTTLFAAVANRCFRGRSSRCLGQLSATRRNCGRAPSSARCQGDSGAVIGGCELAKTAVLRHENPIAYSLDALQAGLYDLRRAVDWRSTRLFRSGRRCTRMTRSGLFGLQCGSALQLRADARVARR